MPSWDLEQSDEVAKYLSKVLGQALRNASLATANRVVGAIQNEIIPEEDPEPVDRGFYRAGWRAEPTPDGADVFNTMPYASIIERGARAENIKVGRKMIQALAEWVQRKGILKVAPGREGKISAQQNAERIAWAIATSMKTRGIFNRDGQKGLRIAEKATRYVRPYILEETKREIKRLLG